MTEEVKQIDSQVHLTAKIGFSMETDNYDKARPSYPVEAVSRVFEAFDLKNLNQDETINVLDLASGTGIFTKYNFFFSVCLKNVHVFCSFPILFYTDFYTITSVSKYMQSNQIWKCARSFQPILDIYLFTMAHPQAYPIRMVTFKLCLSHRHSTGLQMLNP